MIYRLYKLEKNGKVPYSTELFGLGESMFFHEVQTGESLFTISNRYGISIDELRRVNG